MSTSEGSVRPFLLTNSEGAVGVQTAVAALTRGASALDSIEAGIRTVESDPEVHTVGLGSWPNAAGVLELDAAIMDGSDRRAGAVGALSGYLHPISVARAVMERLPHVLVVGEGARRFAVETGAEPAELMTDDALDWWRKRWRDIARETPPDSPVSGPLLELASLSADPESVRRDTTVFLARDGRGRTAVGLSTSGWAFKYPGRLGDTPLIGAGGYADDRYGIAACTGSGELAIRTAAARTAVLHMQHGMSSAESARAVLDDVEELRPDSSWALTVHVVDRAGVHFALRRGDGDGIAWWWDGTGDPVELPVAAYAG